MNQGKNLYVLVELKKRHLYTDVMDVEQKLPLELLNKATLRDNKYAWIPEDIPSVIEAASELNLAVLAVQLQFRLPEKTCELYWRTFVSKDKQPIETWEQYVQRAAQECLQLFLEIMKYDLLQEGLESFRYLREQYQNGVNIIDYACFVVYLEDESGYNELHSC